MRNNNSRHSLHERFFARADDAIFSILSRRQRAMKITSVATLELVTRQVKKSQEKSRQSWNFCDKIAEIVSPLASLRLFAHDCDANKKYLANEFKVLFLVPRSLEVCDLCGLQFVFKIFNKYSHPRA